MNAAKRQCNVRWLLSVRRAVAVRVAWVTIAWMVPWGDLIRAQEFDVLEQPRVGLRSRAGVGRSAPPCSFSSGGETARSWLFGADLGANDGSSTLFRIHVETGSVCTIGEIGLENIFDVAFLPDGRLFGIRTRPSGSDLVAINPRTGSSFVIGALGFDDVNGLVAASAGSLLASTSDGELLRVDVDTGQATLIGGFGSSLESMGDLAISPDGRLFLAACSGFFFCTPVLAEVDPETGEATEKPLPIGFGNVFGLAFEPHVVVAPPGSQPPNDLRRIEVLPRLLAVAFGDAFEQPYLIEIDSETGEGEILLALDTFDGMGGLSSNVRVAPVWGSHFVADERSRQSSQNCWKLPRSWTLCQHKEGFHEPGSQADDTYAWDANLRFPGHPNPDNADIGKPVFALAPGKVVRKVGQVPTGGSTGQVHVEHTLFSGPECAQRPHDCRWWSAYLHMDDIRVDADIPSTVDVDENTILGFISDVGSAGEFHLHQVVYEGKNELPDPDLQLQSVDVAFELLDVPPQIETDLTVSGLRRFAAKQNLVVGPRFLVATGGNAQLYSGELVTLRNGVSIQSGGQLVVETDPVSPAAWFGAVEGRWAGTVNQFNPPVSPYPVELTIDGLGVLAGKVGLVDYSNGTCGGNVLGLAAEREAGEYSLLARITYGRSQCFDFGRIRLSHDRTSDTLQWAWYYEDGQQGSTATLRRR